MTTTLKNGDLVEIARPIPWHEDKPVGTRLLIDSDAYQDHGAEADFPEVSGPFYDAADPQGMWFGGDNVPASHIRFVKRAADLMPSAKDIARGLHSGLMSIDRDVLRIDEVGEQSEDGATLYAYGTTPDGVRVSFLVRVGTVERGEG